MSNEKISISRIGPFRLSYCTAGAGATAAGSIWGAIGASGAVTPGIAATVVGAAAGGFAGSFSGALMNGASFGAAFKAGLKSAAISAATAYAAQGIGGYFNEAKETKGIWANDYANWGGRTLAHATVGGVVSEVQGGEFRHGFYSSAFSTGIMHGGVAEFMNGDAGGWYVAGRTAVAALIGGTAAELAGGKFSNGAWTSALQHLFNAESEKAKLRNDAKRVVIFMSKQAANDPALVDAQGNAASPLTVEQAINRHLDKLAEIYEGWDNHIKLEIFDNLNQLKSMISSIDKTTIALVATHGGVPNKLLYPGAPLLHQITGGNGSWRIDDKVYRVSDTLTRTQIYNLFYEKSIPTIFACGPKSRTNWGQVLNYAQSKAGTSEPIRVPRL
jgi:hypothetical protein